MGLFYIILHPGVCEWRGGGGRKKISTGYFNYQYSRQQNVKENNRNVTMITTPNFLKYRQ